MVQFNCSVERTTARYLAELEKTGKPRAVVLADVELLMVRLADVDLRRAGRIKSIRGTDSKMVGHVRSDTLQVLDVIRRVELGHLLVCRPVWLLQYN